MSSCSVSSCLVDLEVLEAHPASFESGMQVGQIGEYRSLVADRPGGLRDLGVAPFDSLGPLRGGAFTPRLLSLLLLEPRLAHCAGPQRQSRIVPR